MYNPNTAIDTLDFEMTEPDPRRENGSSLEQSIDLPPAIQFVLEVGTQLGHLRTMRLEQEEVV